MSAWVVTNTHINKIINFAKAKDFHVYVDGTRYELANEKDCQELGQILWDENHRSVNFRYSENEPPEKYKFNLDLKADCPFQFIQDLQCLDYQSCETDDYYQSKAYKVLTCFMWQVGSYLAKISRKDLKWGREDNENHTSQEIAPGFYVL